MSLTRSVVIRLVLGWGLAACTRSAYAPAGINITSHRSDYSPTAQLAVALRPLGVQGDTAHTVIDSGSLVVPGETAGGDGGGMYNVYISALLVTRAPKPKGKSLPSPWNAMAESDSQFAFTAVPRGERRAIPAMRFRVERPANLDPSKAWVVFRISGIVIPGVVRRVGQPAGIATPGALRFRVYACADWNLSGRIDRKRAKVMRTSYLKAC